MRRSVPRLLLFSALILALALALSSCGGKGTDNPVPTKITITPTNVSLNRGQVAQVSATATDANNATVGGDITWDSDSKGKLLSVSTTGLLCAGKWDDKFIVCTPAVSDGSDGKPVGTPITGVATLTATMKGVSGTVKVYVHDRIDRVSATAPAGCVSMAETKQFTAVAYSTDSSACSGASECQLPSSTVGPAVWGSTDTAIVSLDNTAEKAGLATAGIPGRGGVIASLSGVNSPSIPFETCAVKSISLAIKDSTATSFAIDKAATKSLVATVVDSKGKTLTAPPLKYLSSQPFAMTVAAQSSTSPDGTATAVNPGTTSIVASCVPPGCNKNIYPIFSNVITGTTNGTATGTVYAASTDSTSLVPIEVTGNTVGTAVTLPRLPDSMVVNRQGTRALLGSPNGMMVLDPTSNAVTSTGKTTALGFLPDGSVAAVVDIPNKIFYGYVVSTGSFAGAYTTTVGNNTAAITRVDPSIESGAFFGVNGTSNYFSLFNNGFGTAGLASPAVDVAVSGAGGVVYLAGGTPAGIDVRAVCDTSQVDTQTATNAKLIKALPDGSGAVAVDDTGLVVLHNATIGSECPPTVSESRSAVALGLGSGFVARQLLVTPDSTKAIVSTDKGLVVVNLSTLVATKIALGGSATGTFTGGVTLDSKTAYFGGDDGTVHRIDLTAATPTDAQQIAVNLKKADSSAAIPNLVVVRNKQ